MTPYSGGNLGDQAIQTAFISNFRALCPGVKLIGLTIAPRATASIHGIPCYPVSGRYLHAESTTQRAADVVGPSSSPEPLASRVRLLAWLRRLTLLRVVWRGLKTVGGAARQIPAEVVALYRAWRLLDDLDLVVAAGGGQLDDEWGGPWVHPYALWRWATLTALRGRRFAVASVGYSNLRAALSRQLVRSALERAAYRSYRDPRTLKTMNEWGFNGIDRYVPDVAFSLPIETPLTSRPRSGRRPVIGVSPIIFGRARDWPVSHQHLYEQYVSVLAEVIAWLDEQGHNVIVFTSGRQDGHAVNDILDQLRRLSPDGLSRLQIAQTLTLGQLLPVLSGCDAIVASRLHGIILAHRMGVPAMAVSVDPKVDEEMALMGCSRYCLDFRTVEIEALKERLQSLLREADNVSQLLHESVRGFNAALAQQFRDLLRLAGCDTFNQ